MDALVKADRLVTESQYISGSSIPDPNLDRCKHPCVPARLGMCVSQQKQKCTRQNVQGTTVYLKQFLFCIQLLCQACHLVLQQLDSCAPSSLQVQHETIWEYYQSSCKAHAKGLKVRRQHIWIRDDPASDAHKFHWSSASKPCSGLPALGKPTAACTILAVMRGLRAMLYL